MQRRDDVERGRSAGEDALLTGEATGHRAGFGLVDRARLVVDGALQMRRDKSRRNALHAVRSAVARREHRRRRGLERDDARVTARSLECPRDTRQHPRRANRAAERVQRAAGLLRQLAADAHVAGNGVLVVELIGPERAGLLHQAMHLGPHAIEERRRDAAAVARDDDQVAAEGAHRVELLFRKGVGRHRNESIAFHGAHERKRRPGAASREFDHSHARFQRAARLGPFDHRERHSIFVGPCRVVVLELDHDVGAAGLDDAAQADERRVADRVQNRFLDPHLTHLTHLTHSPLLRSASAAMNPNAVHAFPARTRSNTSRAFFASPFTRYQFPTP